MFFYKFNKYSIMHTSRYIHTIYKYTGYMRICLCYCEWHVSCAHDISYSDISFDV